MPKSQPQTLSGDTAYSYRVYEGKNGRIRADISVGSLTSSAWGRT
jgi:hypothetical protein